MKELKVKVKRKESWNTVNRRNAELILDNCVFKCDGHYTDDYAYDAQVNYREDMTSEQCISHIKTCLEDKSYNYIKVYWDAKDKEFIFYYGQWLSYSGKPKDDFKVIEVFEDTNATNVDISILLLINKMIEREELYFKFNGYVNIKPDQITIKDRQKYYAIDKGTCGKYLVDKSNLMVYSIKAYGVKNHCLGDVKKVIEYTEQDITNLRNAIEKQSKILVLNEVS